MKITHYHEPKTSVKNFREFSIKLGTMIFERWEASSEKDKRWPDGKLFFKWEGVTIELLQDKEAPAEMTYERVIDIGTFLIDWSGAEDSKVPSADLELFDTTVEGRERPICKGTLKSGLFLTLSDIDNTHPLDLGSGSVLPIGSAQNTGNGYPAGGGTIEFATAKEKAKRSASHLDPQPPRAHEHDHKHKRHAIPAAAPAVAPPLLHGDTDTNSPAQIPLSIPRGSSYDRATDALTIRLSGYVWRAATTRAVMLSFLSSLRNYINTITPTIPSFTHKGKYALWPDNELLFKYRELVPSTNPEKEIVLHITGGDRRERLDVATVEDVARTVELWVGYGGETEEGARVPSSGVEVWVGEYERVVARGILGVGVVEPGQGGGDTDGKGGVKVEGWVKELEKEVLGDVPVAEAAGEGDVGILQAVGGEGRSALDRMVELRTA